MTIDLLKIVSLLWKSERDDEVVSLLRSMAVRQPLPRPKRGEGDVYIEFPDSPSELYFIFRRADHIGVLKNDAYKEGEMVFHTVAFCFHENGIPREARLPFGVNPKGALRWHIDKFGKPQWSNSELGNYRWLFDKIFVWLSFSDDEERVVDVSYFINDGTL